MKTAKHRATCSLTAGTVVIVLRILVTMILAAIVSFMSANSKVWIAESQKIL
jgi:hypothetical protein